MAGYSSGYWKRPAWIFRGLAVAAVLAGVIGLTHALATIAPPNARQGEWHKLAAAADGRFSEASLGRFAASLSPGALALAERYAPAPHVILANNSGTLTELSYQNDPGPLPAGFRQLSPQDAAAANSKVDFSKAPNPAAEPFKLPVTDPTARTHALDCLTMAVYYEAASESPDGQAAVAQVVLNRLRNPLFPKTVCGVVFEGSKLSTGCQFSFTCDGSLARKPSPAAWNSARYVASRALNGYVLKQVGEATHYHTMWVVPYWQPSVVKLTQIGAHIFYRWPGTLGLPGAFRLQYAGIEDAPPPIPGFVGDAEAAELAAKDAAAEMPAPPPTPIPAAPIQLADMTVPKAAAAAVVTDDTPAATLPPPKPNYFGASHSNRVSRAAIAGHW
jgi:spore germination cell wall hydrolase CwlJ-like protein